MVIRNITNSILNIKNNISPYYGLCGVKLEISYKDRYYKNKDIVAT